MVLLLLLAVFEEVLRKTAKDAAADSAQETMTGFLSEHVPSHATAQRAQKATLSFGHWWCVRVVVGRILIA